MTIGTRLYTWLKGESVGSDDFGNRYFQEKSVVKGRRRRRWVLYNGEADATKVPAEWHAWLHYTVDEPLKPVARPWIKPHTTNPTGTSQAYLPPGHDLRGGQREKSAADYEAWQP